jgi:hypothetical protein
MPDAMPTGEESVAMNNRSRSRKEEKEEKKLCMGTGEGSL